MAEYSNLTSLEGLQIGDTVVYDTTTSFDTKGYKFEVKLYGKKVSNSNGGLTEFMIDTSLLPKTILAFNFRGDLIYSNTEDLYYRIAVAGDAGGNGKSGSSSLNGGIGGGIKGGNGSYTQNKSAGLGGTQTSGGLTMSGGSSITASYSGNFGIGGTGQTHNPTSVGGNGGYGWFGGGGGRASAGWGVGAGGGGSGFIIGTSTTRYPDGYLGNDTSLQSTISSAISEGSLTQGGSSESSPKMVLTVLEASSSNSSLKKFKYYNGTSFIDVNAKYYNGTEFVPCNAKIYNGTSFSDLGG